MGFVSRFELSGQHVECQCSSSSPIYWLREMNAALVGLDIFLSSEANDIFYIILGVGRLTSVEFNFIFPWTTTTNSYLQIEHIFCHLLLALNEWNKQDSSHLYHNTKQHWFIFQALNHTNVLRVAGITIFATCGNFSFLCRSCVLLHPHYNTHLFYLSSFQVAFLVPILSPTLEAIV